MKLSDIVRQVIVLAKAADQARRAEPSQGDSPILTSGSPTLATRLRTNADEYRLHEFLDNQPPAVVYMLTAIMYLGRDDFEAAELSDQYTDVSETFGNPKWAARQMLGTMALPAYLEVGVRKLVDAGKDLDRLLPA